MKYKFTYSIEAEHYRRESPIQDAPFMIPRVGEEIELHKAVYTVAMVHHHIVQDDPVLGELTSTEVRLVAIPAED